MQLKTPLLCVIAGLIAILSIGAGCLSILLVPDETPAPAPTRSASLADRCHGVMHEAWRDGSMTDVKGSATMSLPDSNDRTTAIMQLPGSVIGADGARHEITLKCTFNHNLLVALQWEGQQTWP